MSCPESSGGKGLKGIRRDCHFNNLQSATQGLFQKLANGGSNGPPSVILGGHISRKGVQERGSFKRYLTRWTLCCHFGKSLISGQMKKPGLELLQNVCQVK